MFSNAKPMKRWLKWTLGTILGLLLLVLSGIGYLYYQVKSISLEDIEERHSSSSMAQTADSAEKEVPKALDGAVGKANEFANKPVETQDALDVAAILLNSGLSFKEIYWLQGSASDNLTTEEKQRIRDLLLEKLTLDEIEALRAITTQYGKGLLILDPNYPIEAVGVKDEEERSRILKEVQAKQSREVKPASLESDKTADKSVMTKPESTTKPLTEEQKDKKDQIQKTYNSKLGALQADCVARSDALLSQLISDIKQKQANGEDISVNLLQNTYLPKIVASESHCDQEFSSMLINAKKEYKAAGLNPSELDAWQSDYNAAKEQTRSKALSQLSNLFASE